MFTATYPATLLPEADGRGFHVRFPDLPEALTGGTDLQEALAGRIARGDDIPTPSRLRRGQFPIGVPLPIAPKLALYLAIRERGLSKSALARRLGVSETVVRRMLNPRHDTRPEKLQAALAALGKRLVVMIADAA